MGWGEIGDQELILHRLFDPGDLYLLEGWDLSGWIDRTQIPTGIKAELFVGHREFDRPFAKPFFGFK